LKTLHEGAIYKPFVQSSTSKQIPTYRNQKMAALCVVFLGTAKENPYSSLDGQLLTIREPIYIIL
jgi:hypothetical protein